MSSILNNVGNLDILPGVADNNRSTHLYSPCFILIGNPSKTRPKSPLISTNGGVNLPNYITTLVDDFLDSVYRDHLHQNDYFNLDSGISNNGK